MSETGIFLTIFTFRFSFASEEFTFQKCRTGDDELVYFIRKTVHVSKSIIIHIITIRYRHYFDVMLLYFDPVTATVKDNKKYIHTYPSKYKKNKKPY